MCARDSLPPTRPRSRRTTKEHASLLSLRTARVGCGALDAPHPFFEHRTFQHDDPSATLTAHLDIRAHEGDLPQIAPAGMRLFHFYHVADGQKHFLSPSQPPYRVRWPRGFWASCA